MNQPTDLTIALPLGSQLSENGSSTGVAPMGLRFCMPTFRSFARTPFRCSLYEAEDVLAQVAEVELLPLKATRRLPRGEVLLRRISYHDFTKKLMYRNPGLESVRLTGEYDVFIAVCQNYFDMLYLNAVEDWRDKCKTSICWIDELWAAAVPWYKHWLHALKRFDHIFVGSMGSVNALSEAIGRQCHWMPGGVDAIRFSPYPDPPTRIIDVYSMGRRWEGMHAQLRQAAAAKQIFYVHDTFAAADVETYDYAQHREMLANIAKRSHFFVVAPAKMNAPQDTYGQVEIGYRYYEGAAAGAVMIGQVPDSERFREMFGWQDAVINTEPDGRDVLRIISELGGQPDRRMEISCRNAREALLNHDWMYRWKRILSIAGLAPTAGMRNRERRLQELAGSAGNAGATAAREP